MKDNLDKLQVELSYQQQDLKQLDSDAKSLLTDTQKLSDQNKKILEKDADQYDDKLMKDLNYLEKIDRDTQDILNLYKDLIKSGMPIRDDEV